MKKIDSSLVKLQRSCLNCGRSIEVDDHLTRKFCAVWHDDFGNVYDCKSEYHSIQKKPMRDEFRAINKEQLRIANILSLLERNGVETTTDELNANNILLSKCLDFSITDDGMVISLFYKHIVTSNPFTNKHKIQII